VSEYFHGVWTPSSEVLCMACHGPRKGSSVIPEYEEYLQTRRRPEKYEGATRCDRCGCRIVVREDVARHSELRFSLRDEGVDAELLEIGNMAPAVFVWCPPLGKDGHALIIDAADDAGDGWMVAAYDDKGRAGEPRLLSSNLLVEHLSAIGCRRL
jgi:hypothetical protein